jgi:L-methionine (R)-S-oxide reductase
MGTEYKSIAEELLAEITSIAGRFDDRDTFLLETARAIHSKYPQFNWVGFYFHRDGKLHVGPYIGKETPHTVIDIDKGICGAAYSQGKTVVVDDVNADSRYLACSLETKSEIVIPIRVNGKLIGELDIDAAEKAAFTDDHRQTLEEAVRIVGDRLARL